jgi:hypothetical protein
MPPPVMASNFIAVAQGRGQGNSVKKARVGVCGFVGLRVCESGSGSVSVSGSNFRRNRGQANNRKV